MRPFGVAFFLSMKIMTTLHLDFETYSAADLPVVGLDNYASDPTTGVHCVAWCFGDGQVQLIGASSQGWPQLPDEIATHVRNGGTVVAHNAAFELAIWNKVCAPKYGWPILSPKQMRCTMAQAYAMSLPGSLEKAAAALGIQQNKDMVGARVMMQLARPKPDGTFWTAEDVPEKFQRLYDYCKSDVEVERAIDNRMMRLSEQEQHVWVLDQLINQRGIRVDLPAIQKAIAMVEQERARLDKEMLCTTGGVVGKCSEVQLLVKWIRTQGVEIKGLAKADVLDALTGELPQPVRDALALRKEAAKSSTAKLLAMKNRASRDGRVRGCFQYHGASTGRWAHRGIQPGNLPRPRKLTNDDNHNARLVYHINELIAAGARDELDILYGPVMDALADSVRGMIIPNPGYELAAVDFSAIEARVLAWLAGQENVLDIFRTHGKIYEHAASGIYRKPIEAVTKSERQIGKVACFGAQTQVVTNNGVKAIIDVLPTDLLWDGVEWVKHCGVVENGVQPVVRVADTEMTPDHLVLTGQDWTPAQRLISNASTLSLALATGSENLPSSVSIRGAETDKPDISSRCNAPAAQIHTLFMRTICEGARQPGAADAPRRRRRFIERPITHAPASLPIRSTGSGCLLAYPHVSVGATIPTTRVTSTTGRGEYPCTSRGGKTECNSWPTSSHSQGGTTPRWSWIASMLTQVMNLEILGSFRALRTLATNAKSEICKPESAGLKPVFDIVNAGPRHRFTILTSDGPLIVHNCLALGYGGGVGAFQSMARAYGVKVEDALADDIKRAWRDSHPHIVSYWYDLERAAIAAVELGGVCGAGAPGREVRFKKNGSFLWCKLPSGRVLCYPYPVIKEIETPWGEMRGALHFMSVNGVTNKWEETKTYGGSLAENVTQAVARDLLAEAIVRFEEEGISTVMHCHDEIVAEIKSGSITLEEIERIMCVSPTWAGGLPLAAEGYIATRYRK